MRTPLSVVIGAGGTGGHIYPGLALADALRRAEPDAVISFVGTERGLETRLIPEAGYRLHTVDMIPFDPSLGARRYLLPAALLQIRCPVPCPAQGAGGPGRGRDGRLPERAGHRGGADGRSCRA